MRILVCEDEKDLNKVISKRLTKEGYAVDSCYDGEEGLYYIQSTDYDLILLDIMMPKKDGFQVINEMRKEKITTPILCLTAKDDSADIIQALDNGANDYVIKPFVFEELLARIRVLLRSKPEKNAHILDLADLSLNTSTREVTRGGTSIDLSTREYAILEYFMYHINVVLTREQIENHIWSYDYEGGTNLVNVYIRYLRKKIDDPFEKKLIHTIRGSGYVIKDR